MSFLYKTKKIDSEYKKVLYSQKEIIQNNKYMRELEQKYQNYSKRHTQSLIPKKKPKPNIKTHDWPINSSMFTQILKQKLNSMIPFSLNLQDFSSNRQIISRPRTRNSETPKGHSKVVMARNSFCFNQEHENYSIKDKKIVKKKSNEIHFSRLSLDNSGDVGFEDETRDLNEIRIPRYY